MARKLAVAMFMIAILLQTAGTFSVAACDVVAEPEILASQHKTGVLKTEVEDRQEVRNGLE